MIAGPMSPVLPLEVGEGNRLTLRGVSWDDYTRVLELMGRWKLRFTYDRGALEIMTLSSEHERYKTLVGLLIALLAEHRNLPIIGFGQFTNRREDLTRGLEPDQCYYLANFSKVKGKRNLDLNVDPAPDLAIEIDITSSSLDRMGIYAALKVPELWRFDGEHWTVHLLKRKTYAKASSSSAIADFAVNDLTPFMEQGVEEGEIAMMASFRKWLSDTEE